MKASCWELSLHICFRNQSFNHVNTQHSNVYLALVWDSSMSQYVLLFHTVESVRCYYFVVIYHDISRMSLLFGVYNFVSELTLLSISGLILNFVPGKLGNLHCEYMWRESNSWLYHCKYQYKDRKRILLR